MNVLEDLWHRYLELLSDPAHMAVEITNTVIIEVVVLGLFWPWMRRRFDSRLDKRVREEHFKIEKEHDLQHPEDSETTTAHLAPPKSSTSGPLAAAMPSGSAGGSNAEARNEQADEDGDHAHLS